MPLTKYYSHKVNALKWYHINTLATQKNSRQAAFMMAMARIQDKYYTISHILMRDIYNILYLRYQMPYFLPVREGAKHIYYFMLR